MDSHLQIIENDHGPVDDSILAVKQFSDQFAAEVNDHRGTTPNLPIELTNATGTHLDQLNEDCLLEIFSRNSLTIMDLYALAEICNLFKRIAQIVFPKTFTISKCFSKYFITSDSNVRQTASAHNVERIFKSFGQCFGALKVFQGADVMNLIAKHCVAGTLKELEIVDTKITEVVAEGLTPIFRQLHTLTICYASIRSILCGANIFANCDSLIELNVKVLGQNRFDPIMGNFFPNLQRFTFIKKQTGDGSVEVLNFLERHKTLKYLHLGTMCFNAKEDFFPKLGNSCKELEELEIMSFNCYQTLDFSNFQSLKRLKLHCYGDERSTVQLQDAKSLQVLEVHRLISSNKLLEALPLLTNLRELSVSLHFLSEPVQWASLSQLTKLTLTKYRDGNGSDSVVEIIRQLSDLEELDIRPSKFVLTEKVFNEILKVTEGRGKVLTLKCRFLFSQSKICDENLKVKLILAGN